MDNNSKSSRNEKLLDNMLAIAAEEALERRMASLPSQGELDELYPLSPEFERRINRIIAKEERARKTTRFSKNFAKIAACFFAILAVSIGILLSVEASRNFIFNTIINVQDDHVAFEFSGEGLTQHSNETLTLDDFTYQGSHFFESATISNYLADDGKTIMISRHRSMNLGIVIDTDYREFSTIYIDGQEVFLFESSGEEQHVVMWQDGRAVYVINSDVEMDILLEVIGSLIKNN